MNDDSENSAEKSPRIRRGRVDSFALFEITEQELDILESGSPGSHQLNFGIGLFSIAVSFLVALFTSNPSSKVFTVFVVITVVGLAMGVYLLIAWWRHRASVSGTVRRIRGRLPSDRHPGEQSG